MIVTSAPNLNADRKTELTGFIIMPRGKWPRSPPLWAEPQSDSLRARSAKVTLPSTICCLSSQSLAIACSFVRALISRPSGSCANRLSHTSQMDVNCNLPGSRVPTALMLHQQMRGSDLLLRHQRCQNKVRFVTENSKMQESEMQALAFWMLRCLYRRIILGRAEAGA